MKRDKNRITSKNSVKAAVVACVAVVALLGSYIFALLQFGDSDVAEPESEAPESSAVVSDTVSEEPQESSEDLSANHPYYGKLSFESVVFSNEEVLGGALAVLKDSSKGYPKVDEEKLVRVSTAKTGSYGLSGNGLMLNREAMTNIDQFIVNFYNNVPNNGLIFNKAYEAVTSDDGIELSTGYSVKFSIYKSKYKFTDTAFSFLPEQAFRYGVIQRYPADAAEYTGRGVDYTYYRYVGIAHSSYMNYYNYSLEEYIDKIRTDKIVEYAPELDAGNVYVSYYVPLGNTGSVTYVPVPTDQTLSYTVSGDGSSGFIVTVKMPQ